MVNKLFFIAIGPEKTGTTWLYSNLKQHPEVFLPEDKEIRYFWAKEFLSNNHMFNRIFSNNWHNKEKRKFLSNVLKSEKDNFRKKRKINFKRIFWALNYFFMPHTDVWYKNLFDKGKVSGDITPKYSELSEKTIQGIYNILPNAKIIISLRDPIEREWSRAKMNLIHKTKTKDYNSIEIEKYFEHFERPVQHQCNNYVDLIKKWQTYFPEKNILIYYYEELVENPEALIERICLFLEISPIKFDMLKEKVNKGVEHDMPEIIKKRLIELNLNFIEEIDKKMNNRYTNDWLNKYKKHD